MKHWKETAEVFGRVTRLAKTGRRAALATVLRIEGSAYRRPGAKFLVEDGGATFGSISGGCLEADVRGNALGVIREGVPRSLHYDTGADDREAWGLGLGCSGSVDIFVQPVAGPEGLEIARRVSELVAGEAPFAISTLVGGTRELGRSVVAAANGILGGSTGDPALDREVARQAMELVAAGQSKLHEIGSAEIFTEVLTPPPHLVLFGAGDDAIPICACASDVGFRVTVVDHREVFLASERFPGAARRLALRPDDGPGALPLGPRLYTVIKTHSFAHDREWARQLLAAGARYIGLLGPRERTREILRQIGAGESDRVFGPVGLDLGAEGPEQVAVSIVAELLAVRFAREPRHLREKDATIHAI